MSIDRCQRCGDLVDTDNEPEAYVQVGNMRHHEEYICLCQRHREEREDQGEPPESGEVDQGAEKIAAERLRRMVAGLFGGR